MTSPTQPAVGDQAPGAPDPDVPGAAASRPRRADAQRNRQALLEAATEVFAVEGSEAGLEGIAKRAGVGIGTLYRNFPTRQELLEAVYLNRAVELRRMAEGLLAEPSRRPVDDLVAWLRAQMAMGRQGRSLGSSILAAKHQEGSDINTACVAMRDAGVGLLERAQAAGEIGPDVQFSDVLRMVHGIVIITEGVEDGDEQADRMLDLLVGGLRAAPPGAG
jgi:AcrR family transcriptional regulator